MNYLTQRNSDRPADDPIFALNRKATQRRAQGDRVINATVGALLEDDGTLAVLPSVIEALREVPAVRGAAYAPISGSPEFLSAVVSDMLGTSPLAANAVAVATPGGTGALRHAVCAFLERGQTMLTTSFHWGPYDTICEEHERTVTTFNTFDGSGGFDVAALERGLEQTARSQGRVLLFLNDPCHNPTGYSLSAAEWTAVSHVIAQTASRVPVVVVADAAYRAYARDPNALAGQLAPLAQNALLLFAWSASKSFAQYGLRVGALIACTEDANQREPVRRALSYASRGTWSNCNAAGQLAIARCITDASLRARVDSERARLTELLARRVRAFNDAAHGTRLRYPRYDGGFFVTVFADDGAKTAAALEQRGVFVVPQPGAVRVALCGVAASDVADLVTAIDSALA